MNRGGADSAMLFRVISYDGYVYRWKLTETHGGGNGSENRKIGKFGENGWLIRDRKADSSTLYSKLNF